MDSLVPPPHEVGARLVTGERLAAGTPMKDKSTVPQGHTKPSMI